MCACGSVWAQKASVQGKQVNDSSATVIYDWHYIRLETHMDMPMPAIQWRSRSTDRGLFGVRAGVMRIYGDITLPTITSACLVDVGAAMSKWGGLLGQCPRWFTMFHPLACPTDELYGSAKANTAIMVTMRTYF